MRNRVFQCLFIISFLFFHWLGCDIPVVALAEENTSTTENLIQNQTEAEDIHELIPMKEESKKQSLTLEKARVLIERLKKEDIAGEMFEKIAHQLFLWVQGYPLGTKLDVADILRKHGYFKEARMLYQQVLEDSPQHPRALLGKAFIDYRQDHSEKAMEIVEHILSNAPRDYDALFLKGEILEDQKEYIQAIAVYEKIQEWYPQNQAAVDLRIRALMDLGANSLAMEELEALGDRADSVLLRRARGNKAMHQIWWKEPQKALKTLDEELKRLDIEKNNLKILPQEKGTSQSPVSSSLDKYEMLVDISGSEESSCFSREKVLRNQESVGSEFRPSDKRRKFISSFLDFFEEAIRDNKGIAFAQGEPGFSGDELSSDALRSWERKSSRDKKPISDSFSYLRTRWDRILGLRLKNEMGKIIEEYGELCNLGIESPFWIRESVGDAYLYLRQPEKALGFYRGVLKEKPDSHNTRMAIYHTLVELGRFKEAEEVLEELDQDTPVMVQERGLTRENWKKVEIAINKGWLFMYQDRLAEAEEYLENISFKAPFNTNFLVALAQTHLWRGWRRRALEDFQIVTTEDPQDVVAQNGYSLSLNANGFHEEARILNKQLIEKHTKNKHLQRTKRQFDIEEMRTLTVNASLTQEYPGEDEAFFVVRVDQPVNFNFALYAELVRRETTREEGNSLIHRLYVGQQWIALPTWRLIGALSQEIDTGDNFGWLTEVQYAPDDYFTFTAGYDSHTLAVPLRSRVSGTDATETTLTATYRHSELFNTKLGCIYHDFTDGNESTSYYWNTDTALTTQAYWKTRLKTEFYFTSYATEDVDYFAPDFVYSFVLVPMVEHTWYRRYEKALVDRLYVGVGQQWEKDYPAENIGYIRYEQDYKFSDTLDWLIGTTYSLRNYSGDDVNDLGLYTSLKKRF